MCQALREKIFEKALFWRWRHLDRNCAQLSEISQLCLRFSESVNVKVKVAVATELLSSFFCTVLIRDEKKPVCQDLLRAVQDDEE